MFQTTNQYNISHDIPQISKQTLKYHIVSQIKSPKIIFQPSMAKPRIVQHDLSDDIFQF